MSHLPGEALTYQTVISEFFLGLRGGGLMLSPLDVELVQTWERRGLPVAVVCRGLRQGLEEAAQRTPAATPPRALRAYRLSVEAAWTAYRRARVGDAPPPPDEGTAAARRLEAARCLLARAETRNDRAPLRTAYRRTTALLAEAPAGLGIEDVDDLVEQVDTVLLRAWLGELDRATRTHIGRSCAGAAGPRAPWTRRADHRSALRSELVDEARRAGLLCLRGSV